MVFCLLAVICFVKVHFLADLTYDALCTSGTVAGTIHS